MSNIGLRLFQQLKGIDAEVSRADYFDEEQHSWDVEGLEEDLKVAQDRLHHTGSTSINNTAQTTQQILPSLNNNTNNYLSTLPQINNIPTTTTLLTIQSNHIGIQNMNNNHNHNHIQNTVNTSTNNINNIISNTNDNDEDIDLNHIPSTSTSSQSTDNSNPLQMPSPNASPSIEYEPNDDLQLIQASQANNTNNMNNMSNDIEMKSSSRKRKNGHDLSLSSMPLKKQKVENKWNELALKKLFMLKRQVKNSGWFWEPVDEIKHSAPNYYLVCPLPSDYGTICSKLERHQYNTLDSFLRDCELVFINARLYNTSVHAVHVASMDLEKRFKELMNTFVVQHWKEYGSDKTLHYWQNAKKNYKPFAVPVDE